MSKPIDPMIGIIVSIFLTTVLYIDGYWDPQIGIIIGIVWAVAGWLYVRNWNVLRQSGNLWYGLFIAVVAGSSFFGVHADLPISEDLRIALGILVLGIGTAALGIGVEIATDVTNDVQRDTITTSD